MNPNARRLGIVAAALSGAALLAIPAFAGRAGRSGSGPLGGRARLAAFESFGHEPLLLRELAERLELTSDQKARLRDVLRDHWRNGLGSAADTSRKARRDLRHAIQSEAADDASILAACRAAASADEAFAKERHEAVADLLAVLTPEQKAEAARLRSELERLGDDLFERVDRFLSRS